MVTELNIESYVKEYAGSGSEEPNTNPEWPDKSRLTLGNTITFANKEWIVSHVTETEAYLTLKGLSGSSSWDDLLSTCNTFANQLNEAQKACLKSVTAGNTSGKVFVATKDQMNGGFSYFNSTGRRSVGGYYWTSTNSSFRYAWVVSSDGYIGDYDGADKSRSVGFRPSVCVDLTLYV